MKKTAFLLIVLLTTIFFGNKLLSQEKTPLIHFGIIADIQYGDCEPNINRYYRDAINKLGTCVSDLNDNKVQFTINLGDLIDRNFADLDSVLLRLKKLEAKVYNTTGNHDYAKTIDNKTLYKKLNMPSEYYTFKKKNWRFIILNTNEIASYSNIKTPEAENELAEMMQKIKSEGRKNGYSWNGGISNEQMQWLDKLLSKAQKNNENVLIFSHHPLFPDNNHNALNDKEILETITKYNCVKAAFSGHNHAGNYGVYNNIPFTTIQGMIETEKENAYAIVKVYDNSIEIDGKGRVPSRQLNY